MGEMKKRAWNVGKVQKFGSFRWPKSHFVPNRYLLAISSTNYLEKWLRDSKNPLEAVKNAKKPIGGSFLAVFTLISTSFGHF